MAVDPAIAAIFGQPPAGIDLSSQSVTSSNAASTVFFVVAALCVALRFYVRVRNDTVGRDDYTIVAGFVRWMMFHHVDMCGEGLAWRNVD